MQVQVPDIQQKLPEVLAVMGDEAKEPPGWELTSSKFDRIADLVDVLGCVATYNTVIQADQEPIIYTTLPAVLRLTQQTLKTPAKGR